LRSQRMGLCPDWMGQLAWSMRVLYRARLRLCLTAGQVPLDKSPRAQWAVQHGTKWLKALYRGYTDSSFSTYSPQPPWQGTQGPTLRSEVGDMIEIMFVNKLSKNYVTMHSMGLAYNKVGVRNDRITVHGQAKRERLTLSCDCRKVPITPTTLHLARIPSYRKLTQYLLSPKALLPATV